MCDLPATEGSADKQLHVHLRVQKCRKKLEVTFQDNPHVESVELEGNINYPNVQLSETVVNFSSALNDTIVSHAISVVNTCEVPVRYKWELVSGDRAGADVPDATPSHELFDIKPLGGLLQPGGTECVWISYFARANAKALASAVMHVQGGPDTLVTLQANASQAIFQVEPRTIKCGLCVYSQQIQKEVTVLNPSKCAPECHIQSSAFWPL